MCTIQVQIVQIQLVIITNIIRISYHRYQITKYYLYNFFYISCNYGAYLLIIRYSYQGRWKSGYLTNLVLVQLQYVLLLSEQDSVIQGVPNPNHLCLFFDLESFEYPFCVLILIFIILCYLASFQFVLINFDLNQYDLYLHLIM